MKIKTWFSSIFSNKQKVDFSKLVSKNNLVYLIDSQELFNGTLVMYHENKKLKG